MRTSFVVSFIVVIVIVIVMVMMFRSENMFLKTSDNIKIAYDWYPVDAPKGYLVLVHMMPAAKESWKNFALKAKESGYASLAIDLRGHGQSDDGPEGFLNFSDEEHQKSILDLQTAVNFLKERGAAANKIAFIGASIGANLSLRYIAEHPEFNTAVLLSAGLNYRGIKTAPFAEKLKSGQKIMLVASKDDGNSVEMNQALYQAAPAGIRKELVLYSAGGHGTDLLSASAKLEKEPDLSTKILDFISRE